MATELVPRFIKLWYQCIPESGGKYISLDRLDYVQSKVNMLDL